ncbi:MAG: hypothetical protein ABIP38_09700 [Steroidobacteraceae bacterium]
MELLKALRMPFQMASLLFVALSSLLLALVLAVGAGSLPTQLLGLLAIMLLMVWLTQFAFALIDDAANGVAETSAATAEMLSPIADPRCWVHPFLIAVTGGVLFFNPSLPVWPAVAAAVLLFPASIGATAISGRARDAVNPVAMANLVRGLGRCYVLTVLWIGLCAFAAFIVNGSGMWSVLRIASLELLLLLVYAFIGGAVYMRRMELGFQPKVSPERTEERLAHERGLERQRMIDGLYRDVRVREPDRAIASMKQWLAAAAPTDLRSDVLAILTAGASWSEPRGFSQLLRGLIPPLIAMKQLPLAFAAAEAGMSANPAFTPGAESEAIAMIRFAQATGRKRTAVTLLANFMDSIAGKAEPGSELLALRDRLREDAPAISPR